MGGLTAFSPALVTGASGFIGSCLVRRLAAAEVAVHATMRPTARPWRLRGLEGRITLHGVDLTDADSVDHLLQQIRPRAVFHLAAHGVCESHDEARRILSTNILGTQHVLSSACAAGVALFVNAGSSSEYGYKDGPMRETDRIEPNSVYAVAKAAQTHLCSLFGSQASDMAVVTFRLFSVYGPWEAPTRLLPTLLRRARRGQSFDMASPDIAHDFVYVDDVLDAFVAASPLTRMRGEVINLGTGVQSTLADVVAAVDAAVGTRSEVRWGAMSARRWDTVRWQADRAKAAEMLAWEPRYSLRQGVMKMARWMDEADGYPAAC